LPECFLFPISVYIGSWYLWSSSQVSYFLSEPTG